MSDFVVKNFKYGVINNIEAQSIPDGAASDALNWLTKGDKIELRRGSRVVGSEIPGTGRVTGLFTAYKADGTEVKFGSRGERLYYYDTDIEKWVGVGMDSVASALDSYVEANQTYQESLVSSQTAVGQTFLSPGGKLTSCQFYLKKINSPTGNAYAKLYAVEDGVDSNGNAIKKPTGDALATSDALDVSTLGTSFALAQLNFTGTEQYILDITHYAIILEYTDGTPSNFIQAGTDYVNLGHSGNLVEKTSGTWSGSVADDVIFYVNGYAVPDLLPDGEDVTFDDYTTNAGAQVWVNSPNSSLLKIMTANPGSYTDMYNGSKNFKGFIKIEKNRMWLWGRNEDKTGVYGSYIDNQNYTTVTAENRHNGDGSTKTFSGTLAFKGAGATRTCFGVSITDGTETFTDDYNGVLTGSLGGTGTINYTTGAYSVTFNTAPVVGVNNITATYQWEDSNNAGISDFSKSATRLAGQGFIFRQDDGGGKMQNIFTLGNTQYCVHEFKTWALTLTATDTNATNEIFRQNVGIPYMRAGVASSVGIFYIDNTDKSKPLFRKLILNPGSSDVIPKTVTYNLNLEGYEFDKCAMHEWNDYILFSGKATDSTVNNRFFAFHKIWESVDILDYYVSVMTTDEGTLLSGESISNNFVTLFSGYDDSDSLITNFWEGNISELRVPGRLKKVKKFVVEGDIQPNQGYDIYISTNRGGYVLVGSISGTGSYVDTEEEVVVGVNTVGSKVVGGGGDEIVAYHYKREIRLALDKLENRKVKFVATGIGYVSISMHADHDIRLHQKKIPRKYRT